MKKKITYQDIMNEIVESLKKEGVLPKHLDYVSVDEYNNLSTTKITATEYLDLRYRLDYGSSEGIYLDVEAFDFRYPDSNIEDKWFNVLTIKTLNTDDTSMIEMASIIGYITIKFRKYIHDNWKLLNRIGYAISCKKDKNAKPGLSCIVYEKAQVQANLDRMMKFHQSYNYFEIIDQDTLEVIKVVERKNQ